MGMNMVSKGCEAAVREVQRRFEQARLVTLSGNMCTDKKPSGLNWTEGRGKSVVVRIPTPPPPKGQETPVPSTFASA